MNGKKSGFNNKRDQNNAVAKALSHPLAKAAIARLNGGSKRETVNVPAAALNLRNMMASEWQNGNKVRSGPVRLITLVLGHFNGEQNNRNYQVHLQTAFPRL